MGRMIEEAERAEAEKREAQAAGQPRGVKAATVCSGKFPEQTGQTRDKVGEALGMSGKTYEAAKAVRSRRLIRRAGPRASGAAG